MLRLRQADGCDDFGVSRLHRKRRVAVEWGCASSLRSRKFDWSDSRPHRRWPRRELRRADFFWVRAIGLALAPPVPSGQNRKRTLSAMWKPSQTGSSIPNSAPEPQHAAPPAHVPETPTRCRPEHRASHARHKDCSSRARLQVPSLYILTAKWRVQSTFPVTA